MLARIISLLKKQEGQGLVEYALIIVLISVVAMVAMGLLGTEISSVFGDITTKLSGG